jgi:hypothetical protein
MKPEELKKANKKTAMFFILVVIAYALFILAIFLF